MKKLWIILALAVIGLVISSYMTYGYYDKDSLGVCNFEGTAFNCETLVTMGYGEVPGMPWLPNAALGILGYLGIAGMSGLMLLSKKHRGNLAAILLGVVSLGLIYQMWLTSIEVKTGVYCAFCLTSQIIMIGTFFSVLLTYLEAKHIHLVIE